MLKVSGVYVSPFEVEATLVQHPSVLEAAVIGAPDADGLIKTKAFVVLKAGRLVDEAELKGFVKDRLAPYKYPRSDRVHRRTAEDRDRQDPAVQAARAGTGRPGRVRLELGTLSRGGAGAAHAPMDGPLRQPGREAPSSQRK